MRDHAEGATTGLTKDEREYWVHIWRVCEEKEEIGDKDVPQTTKNLNYSSDLRTPLFVLLPDNIVEVLANSPRCYTVVSVKPMKFLR